MRSAMPQWVARVELPALPPGERYPVRLDGGSRVNAQRFASLAVTLAWLGNGGPVVLEVNERRHWRAQLAGVLPAERAAVEADLGRALDTAFGPAYAPAESYSPDGPAAASARDVATAFGGRYTYLLPWSEGAGDADVVY